MRLALPCACAALPCACSDGIIGWIKKKTGPSTLVVEEADKLKGLEEEVTTIVVGYKLKVRAGGERWRGGG